MSTLLPSEQNILSLLTRYWVCIDWFFSLSKICKTFRHKKLWYLISKIYPKSLKQNRWKFANSYPSFSEMCCLCGVGVHYMKVKQNLDLLRMIMSNFDGVSIFIWAKWLFKMKLCNRFLGWEWHWFISKYQKILPKTEICFSLFKKVFKWTPSDIELLHF